MRAQGVPITPCALITTSCNTDSPSPPLQLFVRGAGRFAMVLGMRLGCFRGVVRRMVMVAVSHVRVMRGHVVVTGLMVARRFPMMSRGVFVVFCCSVMMLGCFLRHWLFLRMRLLHWAGGTRLNPRNYARVNAT